MKVTRQPFTEEEDQKLRHIMETVEFEKWTQVATLFGGTKNPRQCRDRWVNYLCPGVNTNEWTEEEDLVLVQTYQKLGKKWSKIANFLPGRSENNIKNRWHSYLKKRFENEPFLYVDQIKQIIRECHRKSNSDSRNKTKHQRLVKEHPHADFVISPLPEKTISQPITIPNMNVFDELFSRDEMNTINLFPDENTIDLFEFF